MFIKQKHDYGWLCADGVSGVSPVFQVLSNGSTTPTIGTTKTFQRSIATEWYFNTQTTIAEAATGVEAAEAFAPPVSTTRGGVQIWQPHYNKLLRSEQFDNAAWTAIATGAVTAAQANGPDGSSNTADKISGGVALDGISQDSGFALNVNDRMTFSVFLRSNSGTRSVSLVLKDETPVTPQSATTVASVTSTWKQFLVSKKFTAGVTGTAVCDIVVGDTTGYEIYAFGAQLSPIRTTTDSFGNNWDSDFNRYIRTTTAEVFEDDYDLLRYTGSEVTAARTQRSILCWYYLPNFTNDFLTDAHYLFALGHDSNGVSHAAFVSASTATINVFYGNNTSVDSTGLGNRGAWNQVIVVSNYGTDSYQTYINGTQVHTTGTSYPDITPQSLNIGKKSGDGSNRQTMYNGVIGWTELYAVALTQTQVTNLYNAQKGNYGL